MTNEQGPPRKRGCFFYGCLTCIVLSLVVVLVGYLGLRYVRNRLMEFTDTKPALIESVEVSAAQYEALEKRLADFGRVLDEKKVSQELRLTAEDINALIAKEPKLKEMKNKVFVLIEGDRLQGKVSWPLDNFGPFKLKGRYLNGVATLKASLRDGIPLLMVDAVDVNGKTPPPWFVAPMKRRNLAQNMQDNPKTAEQIKKFESIEIKDGAVILKNKAKE